MKYSLSFFLKVFIRRIENISTHRRRIITYDRKTIRYMATIIKFQRVASIRTKAQSDYYCMVWFDYSAVLRNIILFGSPFPRAIRIRCFDITSHYQLLPVPFPCLTNGYFFLLPKSNRDSLCIHS